MLQIGIREPGSAITHFIAMMMAIFATSPLLVKAALNGNHTTILAMAVFMGSMVLLYGASTVYHSLVVRDKILKIFRKLDHMMIFVLIAGSYTPVCLIVLGGKSGYTLLAAVWLIHLIYNNDRFQTNLQSFLQYKPCLRHRTFESIHKQNASIRHIQYTFHFTSEVTVSRSINNVNLGVLVVDRNVL